MQNHVLAPVGLGCGHAATPDGKRRFISVHSRSLPAGGKGDQVSFHMITSDLACPRDVPGRPSTASGRRQKQPMNLKPAQALNGRSTHENTLVMRSSLDGDEDQ